MYILLLSTGLHVFTLNKVPTKCTLLLGTHQEHSFSSCRDTSVHSYVVYVPVPTEKMLHMGFTLKEIQESLAENRYDEVCATYMLLAREMKSASVSASKILQWLCCITYMHLCVSGKLLVTLYPTRHLYSLIPGPSLPFVAHRNNSG